MSSRPSGPLNNAPCGSHLKTSGATSGSPSAIYGGLLTITSTEPRSSGGRASNHEPWEKRTFAAALPSPAALARATSSASPDTSVPHTSVPSMESSAAQARAIAPEPVPRSTTTRRGVTARAASIANSASSSVSGRGMSTRGSTISSTVRNAHDPSTYCRGSPERLRATIASTRATVRSVTGSSRDVAHSKPSRPPASWQIQRAALASPTASEVSTHSCRHVRCSSVPLAPDTAQSSAPASRRVRSSVWSASTSSSRSPASTSCRRYTVYPMR
ncbi:unannotated protein [freshwater metagenome]|uniref:Unannotated protein n=1 Tax=freshwater metagenome TaxID=449393 RepID=A0A6J6Q259_9ZZZZ